MNRAAKQRVSEQEITAYQTEGVVVLRGVFNPWMEQLNRGADDNRQNLSDRAITHKSDTYQGRFVEAGSHLWPKLIMPTSWATQENFYPDDEGFMPMPDIDGGDYDIRAWAVEPGDVVAFNFKTVHGANANTVAATNRTVSFRLVGDDAHYIERPGRTSPHFPDIDQHHGERLREDWFPTIYRR